MTSTTTSHPPAFMYDIDPHVAEIYDQQETYDDDIELLRRLLAPFGPQHILEPFCGTGRILLPLALTGHEMVGLDRSPAMLARARSKIAQLLPQIQQRIHVIEADVIHANWPSSFDVVVLGGNCFYELATVEEQQACLAAAAKALRGSGYLYLDNHHMEGNLDPAWQDTQPRPGFPTGVCADGTVLASTLQTIWYDAPQRLARFRRVTTITSPAGQIQHVESLQQKHPVSAGEIATWLKRTGFIIEQQYGDRAGTPYASNSSRLIIWTRKSAPRTL